MNLQYAIIINTLWLPRLKFSVSTLFSPHMRKPMLFLPVIPTLPSPYWTKYVLQTILNKLIGKRVLQFCYLFCLSFYLMRLLGWSYTLPQWGLKILLVFLIITISHISPEYYILKLSVIFCHNFTMSVNPTSKLVASSASADMIPLCRYGVATPVSIRLDRPMHIYNSIHIRYYINT